MTSTDLIRELEQAGFERDRVRGSHHVYKRQGCPPIVVPHPRKDLGKGLVAKLRKMAGL